MRLCDNKNATIRQSTVLSVHKTEGIVGVATYEYYPRIGCAHKISPVDAQSLVDRVAEVTLGRRLGRIANC